MGEENLPGATSPLLLALVQFLDGNGMYVIITMGEKGEKLEVLYQVVAENEGRLEIEFTWTGKMKRIGN